MKSTGRKMQVSKQLSSLLSINKNNKNIKFLRARQLPEENNIIFRCLHLHEAVILFCPRSVGLEFLAIAWPLIDWGDVRAVLSREMTLKKTPDIPVTYWHKQAKGESHGHWLSCSSTAEKGLDTSEVLIQLCGGETATKPLWPWINFWLKWAISASFNPPPGQGRLSRAKCTVPLD